MLKAVAFSKVPAFLPLQGVQLGVRVETGRYSSIFRKMCLSQDSPPPWVPSTSSVSLSQLGHAAGAARIRKTNFILCFLWMPALPCEL